MKIIWTEPALFDLENIHSFIQNESSINIAERVVSSIASRVETLKDFPQIGRTGCTPNTRELIISNTPYIVPYRVINKGVQILAVFHSSRHWPDTLN